MAGPVSPPVTSASVKVMLIANPFATTTTANRRGALAAELAEHVEVVPCLTEYRGHAVELGARAVEHGFDAVFVHGGDGSVNEVVNGLARFEGVTLGLIPSGSGNDLAKSLKLTFSGTNAGKTFLVMIGKDQFKGFLSVIQYLGGIGINFHTLGNRVYTRSY